jgi:hypothetical protein
MQASDEMAPGRRSAFALAALLALLAGCAAAPREGTLPLFVHSRTEFLVVPILEAHWTSEDRSEGARATSPDLSGPLLEGLFHDDSVAADEAEAVLLGYHLGEEWNQKLRHDLTLRGPRVLPYLRGYRDRTVILPDLGRLDSLRFSDDERRPLFDAVIQVVEKGGRIEADAE